MSNSLKKIEVSKVGSTIEVLVINPVTPNAPECYALSAIKSVVPVRQENLGTSLTDRAPYPDTDLNIITINFHNEDSNPSLKFDLSTVSNQPGWTADLSGLIQASTDICGWMTQSAGGGVPGATESTLQGVLQAIQNHQDFEMKLVRDTGNGDKVVCEIAEYNETTGDYNYIYKDVGGASYVPVGPLEYLDPSAVLNLILSEITSINSTLDVDLSTRASEATLLSQKAVIDIINVSIDNLNTPQTITPGLFRSTSAGITGPHRRMSFMNTGNNNGTVGLVTLKPGESITFSAEGLRDRLSALSYDATGTEFLVTTIT